MSIWTWRGASTDEIYAAMDWLAHRQDAIERKLAAKHLSPQANPHRMALFDLTSSWVTGRCCELAAHGYSRDGKKGCAQIEYGCSPTPADGRWRCGWCAGIPPTRSRSPRSSPNCPPPSASPTWCWWVIAA
uniref:hypothetical protein n=1 Tax=Mycobacterium lacus TaxID=169765 RepID=UPI001E4D9F06|nr:hypothetical protein [Mycobacterium lacus]